MERPAFWRVPTDLHRFEVSEGTSESRVFEKPHPPQTNLPEPAPEDKPALSALASYSIGFANLGLKGTPLKATTQTDAPLAPDLEPHTPTTPMVGGLGDKPALSALACHAIAFADLGLKVQSGSPAEGVVQRGDLVRKISDYDSRDIRHQDVQTLFKNAGSSIKLVVSREMRGSAPQSTPASRASSVPPALPAPPSARDSPYIMAGLNPALVQDHSRQQTASPYRAELEDEMHMVIDQPYRTTPLVLPGPKVNRDAMPTESYLRHHPNPLMRAPPPPHGMPHEVYMKQKVVSQFNSPIGLYSEDNIVNTIVQQTGATPFVYPPPSPPPEMSPNRTSYKKTVVYDPAKSETYKALKESEFGDTLMEVPTPVEPKVFSPAKVNTKNTPHRSAAAAAHSVPGPHHSINSVGAASDNIQQSNTFKRLMHMVLEEDY